jgi:large subunit ribosomal protein L23
MGILGRFKKTKEKDAAAQSVVVPDVEKKKVVETSGRESIILRPLVTEKAAVMTSCNTYAFVVDKNATRIAVRLAIKKMYGINPVRVNIQNVEGKQKRFGRNVGKQQDWKKALITLPKGKTINVHEGV